MMFKYRGTTIRLFSTKLFILVTLAVCAIFAVLSLHEMTTFHSVKHSDSLPSGSGVLELNPPLTRPSLQEPVATLARNGPATAVKANVNNNIPQEERITKTFIHPTITLTKPSVLTEIEKLREIVRSANQKEFIRNREKFGVEFSKTSIVMIVQVHDRADYFSHLLKSLSRAKGIEDALLIISSDYYSADINRLVESIDFCRVIQIFFPFSGQLYPDQFPGTDPNDCPRDISKQKAREIGCNNAETPDMFGHYREAKYTMTKHHWWWKANKVFDMLNATKTYEGPVLFLEEDYYVSPDFYHMLRLLYDSKMNGCKEDCDFITLGPYQIVDSYAVNGAQNVAVLSSWVSNQHNMGLAFDRTTWNKIKKCSEDVGAYFCYCASQDTRVSYGWCPLIQGYFCMVENCAEKAELSNCSWYPKRKFEVFCKTYDEYNWDWSLMKMSLTCLPKPFKSLVLKGPRVFHLGECGLHHKKKDCNIEATVQKYQSIIDKNVNSFYPSSVDIQPGRTGQVPRFGTNGGWGDSRDHALCFQLMQNR